MTKKGSLEIFRRNLGFEGPTNLFLKRVSKSLIRLCMWVLLYVIMYRKYDRKCMVTFQKLICS